MPPAAARATHMLCIERAATASRGLIAVPASQVIIEGHLQDAEWRADGWTDSYLQQQAVRHRVTPSPAHGACQLRLAFDFRSYAFIIGRDVQLFAAL